MRRFLQRLIQPWHAMVIPSMPTEPATASIRDRMRKARLLGYSLLVFLITASFCLLDTLLSGMLVGSLIIGSFGVLFVFVAALNRRGHLYAAGILFISGYIVIAAMGLQFASSMGDFSITYDWIDLAIVPIFASFTLPFWTPLAFAVIDIMVIVSIYGINYLHHTIRYITMTTDLITLFVIAIFIIMTFAVLAAIYAHSIERAVIEADRAIELERANAALELVHMATSEANKRLEELATRDPVTGLLNHRALQQQLADIVAEANAVHAPLGVIFADLDHFKQVNDTWGHQAGDIALRQIAACLSTHVRDMDIVARYGGEEFIVILPEQDTSATVALAERLRATVAAATIALPDGQCFSVTLSLGVAGLPDDGCQVADLLTAADAAMYRAKHSGRNRVCVAVAEEQTQAA